MKQFYHSFLRLLATATDRMLARYLQYLKSENELLRSKLPKRISITPEERRRLLKFGIPVGPAIKDLITIVSPRTFARWVSGEKKAKRKPQREPKLGRPRTVEAIRDLILKLGRETGWGYTRILGELKKLGVRSVARSTVVNILRENGLDPGPKRGEGTWDEFVKRHAQTLWACDFFSKKVWTMYGLVEYFNFFVIHVGSRRVEVVGMTPHPDRAWMAQQARNLSMYFAEQPVRPTEEPQSRRRLARGAEIAESENLVEDTAAVLCIFRPHFRVRLDAREPLGPGRPCLIGRFQDDKPIRAKRRHPGIDILSLYHILPAKGTQAECHWRAVPSAHTNSVHNQPFLNPARRSPVTM